MKLSVKKNYFSKNKTENICIILYLFSFTLRFYTNMNTTITAILWSLVGVLIFIYCYQSMPNYRRQIFILILITFLSLISGLMNKNRGFFYSLYVLSAQSFGLLIYKKRTDLSKIRNYMMVLFWYLTFAVVLFYATGGQGDIYLSKLIVKNTINIMMIFSCCIDLIYRLYSHLPIKYSYAVIGIITSLLCDSSGGILSFSILLVGEFICRKRQNALSIYKILLIIFLGVVVLFFMGYITHLEAFLGDDNSRFSIWTMYYDIVKQSNKNLWFGGPLDNNAILYKIHNIHSNFLNWHCFYGLIPFVFYTFLLIYECMKCIYQRNWYILVICVVLIVRSITDSTDFCFMSIWIFIYLLTSNKVNITSRLSECVYEKKC